MKIIGLCLSILLVPLVLRAGEPLVVPLWTNGAPGFENLRDQPEVIENGRVQHVNNPSLTIFLPPKEKANGAAVLICPGGGFSQLSFNSEGIEPARYFTNLGVALTRQAMSDALILAFGNLHPPTLQCRL
jgi:hypothetical protein